MEIGSDTSGWLMQSQIVTRDPVAREYEHDPTIVMPEPRTNQQ